MSKELQPVDPNARYSLAYGNASQEFVTMRIGRQIFGISVMAVQDVLRRQRIAHVPLAPRVIAGSLNLRGRIVTAIDMRRRLGLDSDGDHSEMMNVVVEHKGELFSLLVDRVGEVLSLPLNKFEKVPPNLTESWRGLSAGVFKLDQELLVILDVESVIHITQPS
jgi:purine-binding chemotaxis protein CheW